MRVIALSLSTVACLVLEVDANPISLYKTCTKQELAKMELAVAVNEPSSQSLRVQSRMPGQWVFTAPGFPSSDFVDLADKPVPISMTFGEQGVVVLKYKSRAGDKVIEEKRKYRVVHKGAARKNSGRPPNVLIDGPAENLTMPLVSLCVGFDSRFSQDLGHILKFKDLDGKWYTFKRPVAKP